MTRRRHDRRACDSKIRSRTCKLLSQNPHLKEAEGVFAAGELAIGGQIVLFEYRSLATSLAGTRALS
jgi:hypothetical protein